MGPAGFLAVLGLIGVWLNSAIASNNASPDPITPALLSHAEGIGKSVPLAQFGVVSVKLFDLTRVQV